MISGIESPDGKIDLSALWRELEDLEANDLAPERRDELMELVERSPAAQHAYLAYFEMTAMLEAEASTLAEQSRLPVVVGQGWRARQVFRQSLLAAAALVVLSAIVATLLIVRQPESGRGHLAVSVTADAQWTINGVIQDPAESGTQVEVGSSVKVRSGTMELILESGVNYVIQGPAHVSFPELDRPILHHGWLWVDSDELGEPIVVETPDLKVRDIGTRFAVRVGKDEPAEVHLLNGKVEVFAKETNKKVASLVPEEQGFIISPTGESEVLALAGDPFPGLAKLLAAKAGYPTTVLSQNPAGYWRMAESEPGFLFNEVAGGLVGRLDPKVLTDEGGPASSSGFEGLEEKNRCVHISDAAGPVPISLGAIPVHNGVIFQDNFNGAGDELHGSTPDVTTAGAKWVASPIFKNNGSVGNETGSATLAFKPVNGVIYTLDATVTTSSGPSQDWIGLGFAQGQAVSAARFDYGGMAGRVWMLHRGADTTKPENKAWMSASVSDWNWSGASPLGGTMDLRIVLDTTQGAGGWTATWFAKRPTDIDYQMVRGTELLINESITSAGLSIIGRKLSASVENFSLTADKKTTAVPLVVNPVEGPANVARKEGAMSFWLRCQPSGGHQEIIWTAGEGGNDESIRAHLTADGRIGFFIENGRYDVLVASEQSVNDGAWHHLAFSWSPSAVHLYLNGRVVASDSDYRGLQQGVMRELRFGSSSPDSDFDNFNGWADEIALWDRALTPEEVAHQYRSARAK
ncbi:LamG-like jellyroll fold domain-containing protein [Haloferula chungangensis]|uniref:LamG-like jellyroll fold domain-containing protein n=1 Tax=Haloferula chungangensis TaxID=1048331 RepID=A0ABW2L493_9BACT